MLVVQIREPGDPNWREWILVTFCEDRDRAKRTAILCAEAVARDQGVWPRVITGDADPGGKWEQGEVLWQRS